jgi:hypothetical protein
MCRTTPRRHQGYRSNVARVCAYIDQAEREDDEWAERV